MVPLTWSPPVLTLTLPSLPCVAVTVMPWPGVVSVLPLAGVMDTASPLGAGLDPPLPAAPAGLPPPPEQAVRTRPSEPVIARAAIHRYLCAGEGPSAPTTEPPGCLTSLLGSLRGRRTAIAQVGAARSGAVPRGARCDTGPGAPGGAVPGSAGRAMRTNGYAPKPSGPQQRDRRGQRRDAHRDPHDVVAQLVIGRPGRRRRE